MNIVFRVDAYPETGLGHFVRSLDIAINLKKTVRCNVFFTGKYSENAMASLRQSQLPFLNHEISEEEKIIIENAIQSWNPSLVFMDTLFPYSSSFIKELKKKTSVVLFHNLCEGRFDADAFILPSAHHSPEIINDIRWKENSVEFYHGFEYILLNERLKLIKPRRKKTRETPVVSITTGGSDPRGILLKVLEWINYPEFENISFKAMPGEAFIKRKELEVLTSNLGENITIEKFNYETLAESDLVISTFGVTSYELIYLGVPVISISHAEMNANGSKILTEKISGFIDLGLIDHLTETRFRESLNQVLSNKKLSEEFRNITAGLIDGKGTSRIINIISGIIEKN